MIGPQKGSNGQENSKGISEKTLVLSIHTNYPPFLDLQLRLSKRHLKFDYDFVVGWDEPESSIKSLGLNHSSTVAEKIASSFGANFHRIPSWVHKERNLLFSKSDLRKFSTSDMAIRCSNTLNYMLGAIPWQKYKEILILDSDMFPIMNIEASPVDGSRPIAGVRQLSGTNKSHEYFWNGLVWIYGDAPFSNLINFDIVKSRGTKTDVGGATNQYIQLCRHLGLEAVFLTHLASLSWGEDQWGEFQLDQPLKKWILSDYRNDTSFYCEIYDGKFLHYRGGSNWMNRDPAAETDNRDSLVSAVLGSLGTSEVALNEGQEA